MQTLARGYAWPTSRGTSMVTSRKNKRTKNAPAPSCPDSTVPLTPVSRKIGETPGNLGGRSEAFKRRRGKTG